MNPDEKTRYLIGSLLGAVIIVVGYGLYREFGVPDQPVAQQMDIPDVPTSATPTETIPGAPAIRMQTDNPVIAGSSGHLASVTGDSNLQYEWSIQGGSFEGLASGDSVTWSAGTGPDAVITCKATNATGQSSTVFMRVMLRQPPSIARFEASPLIVSAGSASRLTWSAGNAEKLTLNPGGQDLTKFEDPSLEVKPAETATYTLTATNSTGITVTKDLTIKVVALPEIVSLRADPVGGSPETFTVAADFKGGKGELTNGGQVVGGGETGPLRVQLSGLKEGAVVSLKVTNEAGAYVTSTLTFVAPKK